MFLHWPLSELFDAFWFGSGQSLLLPLSKLLQKRVTISRDLARLILKYFNGSMTRCVDVHVHGVVVIEFANLVTLATNHIHAIRAILTSASTKVTQSVRQDLMTSVIIPIFILTANSMWVPAIAVRTTMKNYSFQVLGKVPYSSFSRCRLVLSACPCLYLQDSGYSSASYRQTFLSSNWLSLRCCTCCHSVSNRWWFSWWVSFAQAICN